MKPKRKWKKKEQREEAAPPRRRRTIAPPPDPPEETDLGGNQLLDRLENGEKGLARQYVDLMRISEVIGILEGYQEIFGDLRTNIELLSIEQPKRGSRLVDFHPHLIL